MRSRFRFVALFLIAALGMLPATTATAAPKESRHASSTVVRDWERTSILTIYGDPLLPPKTPIAVGVPYLGYTSLAMYPAARAAERQHGSPVAAIAVAAHDVLLEYFPDSEVALAAALAKSLSTVRHGSAKQRGIAAGQRVAHRLIHSRVDDGPGPSIV